MSKNKNRSKKINCGKVVISDDKYFYDAGNFSKPGRMALIVDSNINDELALLKLTTSKKAGTKPIQNYKRGKSRYTPGELYTLDDEGNFIKITNRDKKTNKLKYALLKSSYDMDKKLFNDIKKDVVLDARFGKRNRQRLHNLKKHKNK